MANRMSELAEYISSVGNPELLTHDEEIAIGKARDTAMASLEEKVCSTRTGLSHCLNYLKNYMAEKNPKRTKALRSIGKALASLKRERYPQNAPVAIGIFTSTIDRDPRRDLIMNAYHKLEHAPSGKDTKKLPDVKVAYQTYTEQRNKLVIHNQGLVIHFAKYYAQSAPSIPVLDLVQSGNEGLIRAATKYAWETGYKFSTFASYYIRQKMLCEIARMLCAVSVPHNFGTTARPRSLHENVSNGDKLFIKVIPSKASLTQEQIDSKIDANDILESRIGNKRLKDILRIQFGMLSDGEIDEINARIVSVGSQSTKRGYTLEQIGHLMGGISHERVRQLSANALHKLNPKLYTRIHPRRKLEQKT